jgi:hypothetical protein
MHSLILLSDHVNAVCFAEPLNQPAPPTSVQRLAHLGTLWGLIKYTHPYIAHRSDIDWDKAVVEAVQVALKEETTTEEYREAVQQLLAQLNDPNTRALWPQPAPAVTEKQVDSLKLNGDSALPATPAKQAVPTAFGPAAELSPPIPTRAQPYVDVTRDRVAIVVATDYEQFGSSDKLPALINAFTSAASSGMYLSSYVCLLLRRREVFLEFLSGLARPWRPLGFTC